MISCSLLSIKEDIVEDIYDTLKRYTVISECIDRIGLYLSNIRGNDSYIRQVNASSDGIMYMLSAFKNTERYVYMKVVRK